ncbi:hypothetical protein Pmar_PMAR012634 [Perkinsus marinus ATCC 50983]|uniref:Uncharacterized protein n=1 Tax=Perkinsus marinus (strain ATCC 50983 / TXsc) TaxID=423536 RepID=C5K7W6_PERM5|nr:hypothetical protein Pmar_PMAR012634 [Perkinsus marinus ATCC 50983]EER19651.1 hypothetical protein Pmar_PMAR012634 [Perkinsus marinus ATCC 50983]|eukprot:XP_002787855.1 hypothetical protein Pmar_PMAR012634 [Perkinsus marinus ATCC 50983]
MEEASLLEQLRDDQKNRLEDLQCEPTDLEECLSDADLDEFDDEQVGSSEKPFENRFLFLEETLREVAQNETKLPDFLDEKPLRTLANPATLVTTLLGFGRFTLYTQVKGLSLLCPDGKQVITLGRFISRWDLSRLTKPDEWTEGKWLKIRSCSSLAHLLAPMTLMLFAYVAPPNIGLVVQEHCMNNRKALTAWTNIPISDDKGTPNDQERTAKALRSWLESCSEVLEAVQTEISVPFRDIHPATTLRKWCTVLPKTGQTWSEFLSHEQALHSQLEPAIAWTVRRDKLIKCLTDCYAYFRESEATREQHLPKLRSSRELKTFQDKLRSIAECHAPLTVDDVLGAALEALWSRRPNASKLKGRAETSTPKPTSGPVVDKNTPSQKRDRDAKAKDQSIKPKSEPTTGPTAESLKKTHFAYPSGRASSTGLHGDNGGKRRGLRPLAFMLDELETWRYLLTAVTQNIFESAAGRGYRNAQESGFCIWSFQGRLMYKCPEESLWFSDWRPHPKQLLSEKELESIRKDYKQYIAQYEAGDRDFASQQRAAAVADRKAIQNDFRWKLQSMVKDLKEFRAEMRRSLARED